MRRSPCAVRFCLLTILLVPIGAASHHVVLAQGGAQTGAAGTGVWANFDFVPGERVLFAEDFSKDRVGNFPQRFELVNGNMEVVEWQGKRWLHVNNPNEPSVSFIITLPEKLPTRFTMEFDMTIPWNGVGIYSADKADRLGHINPDRPTATIHLEGSGRSGVIRGMSDEGSTVDPRALFSDYFKEEGDGISRPFRVRAEVDGKYMKVYLDEKRIANMPNADFGRTNKIIFDFAETDNEKKMSVLVGNISINAGGKKMYDALTSAGRVATQGIYFDVGSDRIRGESTPTLKEIGDMLKEHADLKLTIEGHTDSSGNAAANQTLSLKRAQAIKDYLTKTFAIDAGRLVPSGMGSTKPVGSNDTPEGRQANRRVELVKM